MCFPLFHFQSLILLPSHHASEVDDAPVLCFFCLRAEAAISSQPVRLFGADLTPHQVKDGASRSLSGASISIMTRCDVLLPAESIAGLGSTAQIRSSS